MKFLLYVLLLTVLTGNPLNDITKIARINATKKAAEKAYRTQDYDEAIRQYRILVDSMEVAEEAVYLNLGHCYFYKQQKDSAFMAYGQVANLKHKAMKSLAYQQMGTIRFEDKKYEESLDLLKQALINNPSNEEARYNYEMIKKLLREQQQQDSKQNEDQQEQQNRQGQQQKKEQKQQDQQNQGKEEENKEAQKQQQDEEKEGEQKQQSQQQDEEKEGEQKQQSQQQDEEKEGDQQQKQEATQESPEEKQQREAAERTAQQQQRLQEIQMSEEKAKMILEAMRSEEIRYYQQLKKKSKKPHDSSKPDW